MLYFRTVMRLYLSSFRLGKAADRLVGLVRGAKRTGVIVNACDCYPDPERRARIAQEAAALNDLGLPAEELDLRDYFVGGRDGAPQLQDKLARLDFLWVRGGNPFVLRRAMRASGLDRIVAEFLSQDRICWGGYSAGIAVLTPTLRGIEMVDDPEEVPNGWDSTTIWDGLGIIPYAVAPHYRSDHPESPAIEKTVQYYIDHHMLFKALRDGEVIIIDGSREEIHP